ncbi:restriction endonuclease [Sphingomonas sp. RRHST34]|uniref:Restriction endonuclease n=1 Tax=Sphingomonas citri TaxID=2862499 RepID=A0ABS7BMA1_9SPHN|nr:restriction endonuclease [Sphingomonas citri]MBW6530744.1 restriction endonuclease [Sphingomonas citri]
MSSRSKEFKSNKEKGDFLQNLVAAIERILSPDQRVVITSPEFLPDLGTGALTEHDVVLRFPNHHKPILTSIECKNLNKPVGVAHIRDFTEKCRNSGVHNPVFVSRSGYTRAARDRAKLNNVLLLRLSDALVFDWSKQIIFVKYYMNWGRPKLAVFCTTALPSGKFTIYDRTGNEITKNDILSILENDVPKPDAPEAWVGKKYPVRVIIRISGAYVVDEHHCRAEVGHLVVDAQPIVGRHKVDADLITYGSEDGAFEVASTPLAVNGVEGDMLMVRTEPNVVQIWWHKKGKAYPSQKPTRLGKRIRHKA